MIIYTAYNLLIDKQYRERIVFVLNESTEPGVYNYATYVIFMELIGRKGIFDKLLM